MHASGVIWDLIDSMHCVERLTVIMFQFVSCEEFAVNDNRGDLPYLACFSSINAPKSPE
jgi:hypothetical protein